MRERRSSAALFLVAVLGVVLLVSRIALQLMDAHHGHTCRRAERLLRKTK
jgi:hypothetical protein